MNAFKAVREAAEGALGVGNGLYQVALKLITAGAKHLGKLAIHAPNEAAKCLRALILPLAILAVHFYLEARGDLALRCLAGALVLLLFYPFLKVWHIRLLYSAAKKLTEHTDHYSDEELGKMRLVFWDQNLVGSGANIPKDENIAIRNALPARQAG